MHRQSDPMAGAVHEVLRQAGLSQHIPGRGVDLFGGDTGAHRCHRSGLGSLEHRILRGDLVGRLAEAVGAGGIRVVAGFHRSADIDDDDVTGLQNPIGTFVVRVGAVRTRSDNDERSLRMPLCHNRFGDVSSNLCLGTPGGEKLRNAGMNAVNGSTRGAQCIHFGWILDHPQPRHHAGGQHRHGTQSLGQRQ